MDSGGRHCTVIEDNMVARVIVEKQRVLGTGQDSLEGGEGQTGVKGLEVLRPGAHRQGGQRRRGGGYLTISGPPVCMYEAIQRIIPTHCLVSWYSLSTSFINQ